DNLWRTILSKQRNLRVVSSSAGFVVPFPSFPPRAHEQRSLATKKFVWSYSRKLTASWHQATYIDFFLAVCLVRALWGSRNRCTVHFGLYNPFSADRETFFSFARATLADWEL